MPASKQQLQELRDKIAEVDKRIVGELEQRFELSREIQALLEGDGATPDIGEREFLDALEKHSHGAIPRASMRAIFSQIAASARAVERPTRVAFVGPEGNFCHHMVQSYFGASASFIECATVNDVLEQVSRERAAYGVFAVDSSIDGLMPATFALAETDLVLVAERTVPAMLSLMGKEAERRDFKTIYATAAAHAAAELFVEREFPGVLVHDVRSPVEAAQRALSDEAESAAILPEATGRAAGLQLIQQNVSDEPELKYRFGVVGTRPTSRTGNDTTSLLFSLDDTPGTLYQVLSHFAERGLNLKRIQSRPVRAASWDYLFYVEIGGHATDRAVVTALEAVKRSTKYLRLLGSFPTEG